MAERPHLVILAKGGPGWLGGRQYSINLIKALLLHRAGGEDFDVSVLVRGPEEIEHYGAVRGEMRVAGDIESRFDPLTLGARIRWKLKNTFGGWTNPRFEEPMLRIGATFAYPFTSAVVPSADWISDFQYHHYPDRMSAAEIAARELEFSTIANKAQRVVLSSHDARGDCVTIFPGTRGRTAVLPFRTFADPAWLSADPEAVRRKYHLPERFFLISNWLLPTKNHQLVLEALASMDPATRRNVHVVCTGDIYDYRNPGFYNEFLNRLSLLGVREQVSVLGVIPKSDQIQLLRSALAYLQPSLFEGWNTGVEEARMFGRPILLSDIGVHREQSPPGALFFDPHDPAALAAAMLQILDEAAGHARREESERAALADYGGLQAQYGRTFLSIVAGGEGSPPPEREHQ